MERRLLFYNDSRHFYMYCYDPPIRIEDVQAPVDEVAGTGVDTLVYGSGPGSTVFHHTKVGEIWGERFSDFDALYAYQATENIRSLIAQGLDPLQILIERAHQKNLEFFASIRQALAGDPTIDSVFNSRFKLEHPQWCLKSGSHNFDFSHPEVRAERYAFIEETVKRYDVDGIELDWVFEPYFFEPDEIEQNRSILTEYMQQIRTTVDETARAKGRTIALGARVLPTRSGNIAAGLDVPVWLQQGLLDFVVPNFYGYHDLDADFPFEWLVELTRPSGCKVYPALQSRIQGDDPALQSRVNSLGEYPADRHHYYAGAAAYWAKGADGIYLPWFRYPHGSHHQLLSEIHDPDLLPEKPKHYVVRRHADAAAQHGYSAPLPLPLQTGSKTPGQSVPFYLADDFQRAQAILKLRLAGLSPKDSMTVSLNGRPLPAPHRRQPYRYSYVWLTYHLSQDALRSGHNEVAVAIHSRPPRLVGQVALESVEILVDHPGVMPEAE